MHRIRSAIIISILILIVGTVLYILSDESDSATSGSLLITEVSPSDEAVKIENFGTKSVDLKGYVITDGEGKLTFSGSYVLKSGSFVIISKQSGTDWFNSRTNVILFTHSSITKSGSFVLADSSDEVSLLKGNTVIDSVCFGKSTGVGGWNGSPVPISSGQYIIRKSVVDTNCSDDWISTKPGWTTLSFDETAKYPAKVSPFTFPESNGIPILNTLSEAVNNIDISIYLLSSPQVVALLCQKEKSGVDVRVLIEGTPLGVDISTELSLMKSLVDCGGEVHLINYSGSKDCRFVYVHNKYAIIDNETVVITSENWTSGNIGDYGNRGWGAIIESKDYARYLGIVFENDFSTQWGDVISLMQLYPNVRPYSDLRYSSPLPYSLETYSAELVPIMSPDNSLYALEKLIKSTKERLYVEQMDLGSTLSAVTGDTPIAWMSQTSSRGVDVKYILDSSQSNASAHKTYVNMITSATSIQAITVNGGDNFSLIHNKGVIIDDKVWVGSVNWTDTSFQRNRESAVLICSKEISDYFAAYFLSDFGVNLFTVEENGLALEAKLIETPQGIKVLLSASGPSEYTYEWIFGDEDKRTTEYSLALFDSPGPGTYFATVKLVELDLYETIEITIGENNPQENYDLVPIVAIVSGFCILALGVVIYFVRSRKESFSSYRCVAYYPPRFK